MSIIIREELEADYNQVYQVVKAAFEDAEQTDKDEHNLVTRLRKSDAYIRELALVAELDGKIVGHIMFTKLRLCDTMGLTLAPLSVVPVMQGKGVGSILIKEAHKRARELGYDMAVVLGHADYYPKFGYLPARSFGILPPFEIEDKNFMAISLNGNQRQFKVVVEYPNEFFSN